MALKRCTSTEHLWNRKLASLVSPGLSEIIVIIITISIFNFINIMYLLFNTVNDTIELLLFIDN